MHIPLPWATESTAALSTPASASAAAAAAAASQRLVGQLGLRRVRRWSSDLSAGPLHGQEVRGGVRMRRARARCESRRGSHVGCYAGRAPRARAPRWDGCSTPRSLRRRCCRLWRHGKTRVFWGEVEYRERCFV